MDQSNPVLGKFTFVLEICLMIFIRFDDRQWVLPVGYCSMVLISLKENLWRGQRLLCKAFLFFCILNGIYLIHAHSYAIMHDIMFRCNKIHAPKGIFTVLEESIYFQLFFLINQVIIL
jgi:hypothetical protein